MLTLKTVLQATHCLQDKYVPDYTDLKVLAHLLKEGGYKVVLTQGVYDMFHVGHGRYLATARQCGDVLIVGVDSDELTRQMKGPDRPFDNFDQRVEVLAMLSVVNIITRRDVGQHMYDLIKLVQPDVLIMSQTTKSFSDEDKSALAGYCGEIRHLEAKAATTTTAKLRRMMDSGARGLAERLQGKVENFSKELVGIVTDYMKGGGNGNG